MSQTLKIRMLKHALVYRPGDVLPIVPRGQALAWIADGLAEVVEETPVVERAVQDMGQVRNRGRRHGSAQDGAS